MVVIVKRQRTEDIVVLVAGLAIIAAVLLVEPVGVRVSLGSEFAWRVDVAAVLRLLASRAIHIPQRYV